jgi:signal transduction histidine kinase/ligand-binding sensor domain-containing protein/DNA-binding response OmpR family regulator
MLSTQLAQGQESRHYTAMDGLSGTDVTAICENENFLWIAGNEGFNRFDGREFKAYKKESGCSNCLSENNIETMMFDSKGLLWIGLKTGGVDIYDPRKDKFTHISQLIDHYPHRVISIFEDSRGNIWLGSWEEGVYQLEPIAGQNFAYRVSNHLNENGNIVSSIIEKPKGKLWMGTYDRFFVYDLDNKRWLNLADNAFMITQLHDTGEKNVIWASTWEQGLVRISWEDTDSLIVKTGQYLNGYRNLYRVYQASNNRLYLGTWGEGMKMVETTGRTTGNTVEIPLKSDLKSPVILCFFRDRHNKFWVGTYGDGLFRLNTEETGINYLAPINENGLSAAYKITRFGKNNLLIGTLGDGLYRYDLKNERLTRIPVRFLYKTLFNDYILSLYCDDELLIVGHDDFGVYYTPLSEKKNIRDMKQFFATKDLSKVTSIYKDRQATIWLGTKQNGLISVKYQPQTGTFSNYIHYDSFGHDEITGFAAYDDHRLWISTHSGLYLFNTKTNKLEENGYATVSDMVYCLIDDVKNKCLWLGTSVGLRQLDYSGDNRIKPVFPSEILPEGAILDLSLDAENNLWFSIANRVFCFINDTKELKEINQGIFGNRILFSSSRAEVEGKEFVVFGGTDRLLLVNPYIALQQTDRTKIVLTELQIDYRKVNVGEKVYGKVLLEAASEYVQSVTLSYRCKWISLSLSEVGWDHFRNQYQYRIKGFSDEWQYFDISQPLTFSQLRPGTYTLFIRRHGVSSEHEPYWHFHITVRPPWWQTFWFYGFAMLFMAVGLMAGMLAVKNRYKNRQAQRLSEIEKRKKEELLQEKESFFAGLSHDLLTPFSLIIAPTKDLLRENDLTEDKREKLEIISKNAAFLSELFSSILDLKRAEMVDAEVKEKNVELISFCRIIVNAFDYLAKSKHIALKFQSGISELTISTDTVKLERILYNLLSNALKFTPENGRIHVAILLESNNVFVLEITDTGDGIDAHNLTKVFDKFYQGTASKDKNVPGLGLGLYIVRKFVQMLGGNISIKSEQGKGTCISIRLPAKPVCEALVAEDKNDSEELPFILLVEDNEQMLRYLKKRLISHFQVATATNGMEALEFIKKNIPEIVISDIMMPEMDGLALCSVLKATPMLADIFVVLLSARSSTEDELQGYKAGADFYVKKPFDPEILIKQVLNVYTTRRQRKKQIIKDLLTSPQPEKSDIYKDDFLGRAVHTIEKHLMDENFKIDEFAAEMNLSKTVLHRKFKAIIGETPNIFIRNVRLHKAAELLKNSPLSVAEIAYLTGFSQSHYFIKCFKELFEETPKNYRKQQINPTP